jgi:hypothetical protein
MPSPISSSLSEVGRPTEKKKEKRAKICVFEYQLNTRAQVSDVLLVILLFIRGSNCPHLKFRRSADSPRSMPVQTFTWRTRYTSWWVHPRSGNWLKSAQSPRFVLSYSFLRIFFVSETVPAVKMLHDEPPYIFSWPGTSVSSIYLKFLFVSL